MGGDIRKALYASKIISYTQGYMLMRAAAKQYGWNLNNGGIALMWRGGCIIRSAFLGDIKKAFDKNPDLDNLLLDPFFKKAIKSCTRSWRKVVSTAVKKGIPVPAFSTALAFFDGIRSERLPANLLQAQRDYFGAHITSGWTSRAANSSTPTGPAPAVAWPAARTRCDAKVGTAVSAVRPGAMRTSRPTNNFKARASAALLHFRSATLSTVGDGNPASHARLRRPAKRGALAIRGGDRDAQ